MAITIFGVIELGEGSNRKSLPNSTFRLHLGGDTHMRDVFPAGPFDWSPRDLMLTNRACVTVHLAFRPSAGLIYERELYVSKASDHRGNEVLHLKGGHRFFETSCGMTFAYMLGYFLSEKIPGLAELIARP